MASQVAGLATLNDAATMFITMRLTIVGMLAVYIYEYLLTIDDEVDLFWMRGRYTLSTAIFALNRYMPFVELAATLQTNVFNTDHNACASLFLTNLLTGGICIIAAECVLALRVYAIWGRSTEATVILLTSLSGLFAGLMYLLTVYARSGSEAPVTIFHSGCLYFVDSKKYGWLIYLMVVIFDASSLLAILFKGVSYLRSSSSILMKMVFWDGMIYCMCILTLSLINLILSRFADGVVVALFYMVQGYLQNMLTTRFLLRLRREYSSPSQTHISLRVSGVIPMYGIHSS